MRYVLWPRLSSLFPVLPWMTEKRHDRLSFLPLALPSSCPPLLHAQGYLNITTTSEATKWKGFNPFTKKYEIFEKEFRGGMVNSWNKFCFSGGVVEVRLRLPGKSDVSGLWPAFWLMGNLGRATYEHSTNMMWPWSYNRCDRDRQEAQVGGHLTAWFMA